MTKYTCRLILSNPLLTPSVSEDSTAVFPGTRYMPVMSNPRNSTIFVHSSTNNGTNSENVDCKIQRTGTTE
jgi:hypothetical protein